MLDLELIKARRDAVIAHLGPDVWEIERGYTEEVNEDGEETGYSIPIALIGPLGGSYIGPSPILQLVGFESWFEPVAEFHSNAPADIDALVKEVEELRFHVFQLSERSVLLDFAKETNLGLMRVIASMVRDSPPGKIREMALRGLHMSYEDSQKFLARE
jgi:hypothetical protein